MHTEEEKQKWKKLLIDHDAYCYMKPTRYIHDSGYRTFEIGYCTMDKSGKRIKDKYVLGMCSDHIWNVDFSDNQFKGLSFSMDLTLDGYIRLFQVAKVLWWKSMDFVVSSASICEMEKVI